MTLPEVILTDHAMERCIERFGHDQEIRLPTGLIQHISMRHELGYEFRVRVGKVIYACANSEPGVVVIKTIMRDNYIKRASRSTGRTRVTRQRQIDEND